VYKFKPRKTKQSRKKGQPPPSVVCPRHKCFMCGEGGVSECVSVCVCECVSVCVCVCPRHKCFMWRGRSVREYVFHESSINMHCTPPHSHNTYPRERRPVSPKPTLPAGGDC
jgi:hypothetical protein